MSDNGLFALIMLVSWTLLAAAMVGGCGYHVGISEMQRQAVKASHAEYVADENGFNKWQWKATPAPHTPGSSDSSPR